MIKTESSQLRIISFGDLDGKVWGSAVDAPRQAVVFSTPDGPGSATGADAFALSEQASGWRLTGDRFDLVVTPTANGAADRAHERERHGKPSGELCLIAGTLTAAAGEREVQCLGTFTASPGLTRGRLHSARALAGWFASDRAIELLALRPAGGRGHESDEVAATLFEPDGPIAVDDPRLSTTFRAGDRPSRASLELWIGDGDEQHPKRAAAEASDDAAIVDGDGVSLQVTPLRCHTGGLDGAGVYVVARF